MALSGHLDPRTRGMSSRSQNTSQIGRGARKRRLSSIGFGVRLSIATISLLTGGMLTSSAAQQVLRASGDWTTDDGRSGPWSAEFALGGTELGGRIEIRDLEEVRSGNVAGTSSSTAIQFGIVYDDREQAVFSGTIEGAVVSGVFASPDGVSGTWKGELQTTAPPPTPE